MTKRAKAGLSAVPLDVWISLVLVALTFVDTSFHDDLLKLGVPTVWADRLLIGAGMVVRFATGIRVAYLAAKKVTK